MTFCEQVISASQTIENRSSTIWQAFYFGRNQCCNNFAVLKYIIEKDIYFAPYAFKYLIPYSWKRAASLIVLLSNSSISFCLENGLQSLSVILLLDYSNQGHLTKFSTHLMKKIVNVHSSFPTNWPCNQAVHLRGNRFLVILDYLLENQC